MPVHAQRVARSVCLVFALATIPALLSTLETVTFTRGTVHPLAVWQAFLGEAPQWYGWALLAPAIIALGDRFPLRWPPRPRALVVHLVACLLASTVVAFADVAVNIQVRPWLGGFASTGRWLLSGLPATTLLYFIIIFASYALRNAARLREREREAADLAARLRDAQLAALRMQLQPHFVFNSLNAVMALIRDQDTARAVRAVSLLSDVLRAALDSGITHETTLRQEVDFVMRYLEIERVRFGERLQVSIEVPDDILDALVPTFVLQPFVENSLKHGILRERAGNRISMVARRMGESLILNIRDDGCGLAAADPGTGGVGVANARARLARMYGPSARVAVTDSVDGPGVLAEVELPLRFAMEN